MQIPSREEVERAAKTIEAAFSADSKNRHALYGMERLEEVIFRLVEANPPLYAGIELNDHHYYPACGGV